LIQTDSGLKRLIG